MKKHLLIFFVVVSVKLMAQHPPKDTSASAWRFSAWAEMFFIPEEEDFFNPTFYARHQSLHLEGRFNYEDRNTGSLWAGKRFKFGTPVEFVLVPMGGIVFGNTNGIAPGLETEITYKKFDFYTESEYLFDFEGKDNNFFYMYSELAIRPIKQIRTGMIAQRTKLFQSEFEIQHGLFAEYYFRRWRAGVFYFNPFNTDANFWIASVSVDF